MMARFLSMILSNISMSRFFIFALSLVTSCTPSSKCPKEMSHHMLGVVTLEIAITQSMEEYNNGHHFGEAQSQGAMALTRLIHQ
jgi:hypothetical protein